VNGRKRFAASDVTGNLLERIVLPADTGERAGAWRLLERLKASPWGQSVARIRADAGFVGQDWENRVQTRFGWPIEILRQPKDQVGFAASPRRWVIKQTFGCWGRYRRLSKDYEQNPSCSRAMLLLTAIPVPCNASNPPRPMIPLSKPADREDRLSDDHGYNGCGSRQSTSAAPPYRLPTSESQRILSIQFLSGRILRACS